MDDAGTIWAVVVALIVVVRVYQEIVSGRFRP